MNKADIPSYIIISIFVVGIVVLDICMLVL